MGSSKGDRLRSKAIEADRNLSRTFSLGHRNPSIVAKSMGSSKLDRLRLKAIEAASDISPRVIEACRLSQNRWGRRNRVGCGRRRSKLVECCRVPQQRAVYSVCSVCYSKYIKKRETHPNLAKTAIHASRPRKWPRSQHQRRARSHSSATQRIQHRSPVSRQPAWKLGVQPSTELARTQRSHASLSIWTRNLAASQPRSQLT
ncbi:hypothetical protein V8C86DRAFT_1145080 [Haematococcus lacustris]